MVSYNQFIELKKRALIPLYCFLFSLYGKCTGISSVDSTSLAVCHHPKRIHSHLVFKLLAKRGKTTKGWFYGFKLHLVVNDQGELLRFQLTAGNVSDLSILPMLAEKRYGRLFGDKGYISQELFEKLFAQGIKLITKLRAKVKNKFMSIVDKILLRKREMIHSMISKLKASSQIEHTCYRGPHNFVVNLLGGSCELLPEP